MSPANPAPSSGGPGGTPLRSIRTPGFDALYNTLPPATRLAADKAYDLWRTNPRHPSLQYKRIFGKIWSVRITLNYRALGQVDTGTITWFWIGPHAKYDQLLKTMKP